MDVSWRNILSSFSLIMELIREELPHTSTSGDLGLWNVEQSPLMNNRPLSQELCASVHLYVSMHTSGLTDTPHDVKQKQLLSVHLTSLLKVSNLRSSSGLSYLTKNPAVLRSKAFGVHVQQALSQMKMAVSWQQLLLKRFRVAWFLPLLLLRSPAVL